MKQHILRSRAKSTRAWLERIRKTEGYFPANMAGLCARAAFHLASRIKAAGLPAVVKLGDVEDLCAMHCYVESGGYICDVTVSQFKGPKVRVIQKAKANHNLPYKVYGGNPITFRSMKNPARIFRHFDRDLGWGDQWSPRPADFKRFDKRNYK